MQCRARKSHCSYLKNIIFQRRSRRIICLQRVEGCIRALISRLVLLLGWWFTIFIHVVINFRRVWKLLPRLVYIFFFTSYSTRGFFACRFFFFSWTLILMVSLAHWCLETCTKMDESFKAVITIPWPHVVHHRRTSNFFIAQRLMMYDISNKIRTKHIWVNKLLPCLVNISRLFVFIVIDVWQQQES